MTQLFHDGGRDDEQRTMGARKQPIVRGLPRGAPSEVRECYHPSIQASDDPLFRCPVFGLVGVSHKSVRSFAERLFIDGKDV